MSVATKSIDVKKNQDDFFRFYESRIDNIDKLQNDSNFFHEIDILVVSYIDGLAKSAGKRFTDFIFAFSDQKDILEFISLGRTFTMVTYLRNSSRQGHTVQWDDLLGIDDGKKIKKIKDEIIDFWGNNGFPEFLLLVNQFCSKNLVHNPKKNNNTVISTDCDMNIDQTVNALIKSDFVRNFKNALTLGTVSNNTTFDELKLKTWFRDFLSLFCFSAIIWRDYRCNLIHINYNPTNTYRITPSHSTPYYECGRSDIPNSTDDLCTVIPIVFLTGILKSSFANYKKFCQSNNFDPISEGMKLAFEISH